MKNHFKALCAASLFIFSLISFALPLNATDWPNLRQNFKNPPMDCRPHTRWWWPFSVTKKEITWELEQMHSHGISGVEQITMNRYYEKGNVPFMSDQFIDLLKHTVQEAKRLGMQVSINFGGPGWIIGGEWVPQEERSKDIVPTSLLLHGPEIFNDKLPSKLIRTHRSWEIWSPKLSGEEKLLAVVAGQVKGGVIDKNSLMVLTSKVEQNRLVWQVPAGEWRLVAFWLKKNSSGIAVDHFSVTAMQHYCDYFGGKLYRAFGDEFGKTVDSFFADSFELPDSPSGVYWSENLLDEFRSYKGYDLTPYLPAIWWQVGEISPKIRYDVNEFLHHQGLKAFFKTFLAWCHDHGIKGRIQPYGFTTDNIEAAGLTDIPEMEITPGEKDQHPWFDTRIGPKKYVASGAHIYGRPVVSLEAYTYIHWERYRATLEELKIASDGFLRCGATKFYNAGYSLTPEREVAPTRTIPFAPVISHQNIWWDYYPLLADYVGRCSWILRQGHFAPDIAIYSPLANQWTLDVLNARKWTREFDWGELGELLIANGYDFDLLNDDALQHISTIENGRIRIRNMEYKMLLIPNIKSLPLETLQFIEKYVQQGGVAIALDRLPASSVGMKDFAAKDIKVRNLIKKMFNEKTTRGQSTKRYGKGWTYFIEKVIHRPIWWDQYASYLDPFLEILRKHVPPDFGIDFAYYAMRKNRGLSFTHRKLDDADIYFVTNIQDRKSDLPVTFRTKNFVIEKWNPYSGKISPVYYYRKNDKGIEIPLKLGPYESTIFVFRAGHREVHVTSTNFDCITKIEGNTVTAIAALNGEYQIELQTDEKRIDKSVRVFAIPAPLLLSGQWKLILGSRVFPRITKTLNHLISWTHNPQTRYFSGTGRYEIQFDLPQEYIAPNIILQLDLGRVGNIGDISLNGQKAGIIWMRGQTVDITRLALPGKNNLVVDVTNTLINRVSAMKKAPPLPKNLVPYYGAGTKQMAARTCREFGFKALPASGLMGPVRIIAQKRMDVVVR